MRVVDVGVLEMGRSRCTVSDRDAEEPPVKVEVRRSRRGSRR